MNKKVVAMHIIRLVYVARAVFYFWAEKSLDMH